MEAITVTEQFGIDLSQEMMRRAQELTSQFLWLAVSIAVLAAGAALIARRIWLKKPPYLDRRTTPLFFHWALMGVMLLSSLVQTQHLIDTMAVVLFILCLLLMIAAIIGLLLFRRFGVYAAIGFFWLSLPIKDLSAVLAAQRDFAELGAYSPAGQAGVYAAADYIATRALVLELFATVLTVLIAGYYARRRYLFADFRKTQLADLVACPACGIPLVFDGDYCPCCGQDIRHLPRSVMTQEPVVKEKYCRDCGSEISKNGKCLHCNPPAQTAQDIGKSVVDLLFSGSSYVSKAVAALLVGAVFLPLFLYNGTAVITASAAENSNAYVALFNEMYANHDLIKDESWLQSFDEASDALYQTDAQVFSVEPAKLDHSALYAFVNYSDAAYQQMITLEQIQTAVHSGDLSDIDRLAALYNDTDQKMRKSLSDTVLLTRLTQGNIIQTLEYIVVDAVRFYLSYIPRGVLMIVTVFAAALALFAAGIMLLMTLASAVMILTAKQQKESLFIKRETTAEEDADACSIERRRYLSDRLLNIGTVAAGVLIVAGAVLFSVLTQQHKAASFESAFTDLYLNEGTNLTIWIDQNRDLILSEESVTAVHGMIEEMHENAAIVISADVGAVDDTNLQWNISLTTRELDDALTDFDSVLTAEGTMPEAEQIFTLIERGLRYQQQLSIQNTIDAMASLTE